LFNYVGFQRKVRRYNFQKSRNVPTRRIELRPVGLQPTVLPLIRSRHCPISLADLPACCQLTPTGTRRGQEE